MASPRPRVKVHTNLALCDPLLVAVEQGADGHLVCLLHIALAEELLLQLCHPPEQPVHIKSQHQHNKQSPKDEQQVSLG